MTDTDDRTDQQHLDTLNELTGHARFAMFTTVGADGRLYSRPMTLQQVDLDVVMWFIAARDSRKVEQIRSDPTATVTISSSTSWVSLSGRAAVVDDVDQLRELWSTFAEAWLDGPDDPNAILVRVDVDSAEYWDSPGGRVATALSLVKSKITGETTDAGRHGIVDDL